MRRLLEEVLAADPKFACVYCLLAGALVDEGEIDDAERLMRLLYGRNSGDTTQLSVNQRFRFAAMRGDSALVRSAMAGFDTVTGDRYGDLIVGAAGTTALRFGQLAAAQSILEAAAARGEPALPRARLALALAYASGQWRGADRHLATLRAGYDADAPDRLATEHVVWPPFDAVPGGLAELRRLLLDWDEGPVSASDLDRDWPRRLHASTRLYLLGLTASRMGDRAGTRAYADSLDRLAAAQPQDAGLITGLAHVVRADRAVREDQPRVALQELERVDLDVPPSQLAPWVSAHWHACTVRAHAHMTAGESDRALQWLRHCLGSYGGPDASHYGTWHRDMALTLDALGRGDEAIDHYVRFVNAWANADPELQPQVQAARDRLARLTAER